MVSSIVPVLTGSAISLNNFWDFKVLLLKSYGPILLSVTIPVLLLVLTETNLPSARLVLLFANFNVVAFTLWTK